MTTLPNRTSVWNWLGRRKDVSIDAPSARFAVGRVRRIFAECVSEIGGEASARARAATLATIYRGLDDGGKRSFLTLLAMQADAADASAASLVDVYEPSEIEENHEAYFRDGKVATSAGVRRLLRKGLNGAGSNENSSAP